MSDKVIGWVYCPDCNEELAVTAQDLEDDIEEILQAYLRLSPNTRACLKQIILDFPDIQGYIEAEVKNDT